jgi:ribosomal RNA-processing protein 8
MREKLVSARFRSLNETLYTRPSEEAFRLFREQPEMFNAYHEGFRRQVEVWPENPVEGYVRDLRERGSVSLSTGKASSHGSNSRHQNHHRPGNGSTVVMPPLPRTNGTCTVADLGCGDAGLAAALQPDCPRLRIEVLSFDLQKSADDNKALVTVADIANLPLPDGAVDVAVFCLALMGTNWLAFVDEAHRILRWKGELWVAEIKSRFGRVGRGKNVPVAHSVGARKKSSSSLPASAKANKAGRRAVGGHIDADEKDKVLAVHVDGADDPRQETDVSAFVEALARRGFVLHGDPSSAVDLSNRMFVKMRFLKVAAPSAKDGGDVGSGATGEGLARRKKKFVEPDADDVDESAILKPCVYKIR